MKKLNPIFKFLSFALFIVLVFNFYSFQQNGYTGFSNTILIYLFLITTVIGFFPNQKPKNKIYQFNFMLLILLLFSLESFLKLSGLGYLSYGERNYKGLFTNYISPFHDYQKTRFIPPLWISEPNKNFSDNKNEFSYSYTYNSIGLREKELSDFKNKKTILFLGDSFTEGAGTPNDSTGIVSVENKLKIKNLNYSCYNGGSSGSDICFAYRLYTDTLYALKPEVVVINLNNTDLYDIYKRGGDERFVGKKVKYSKGPYYEWFYGSSYIVRTIISGIFKINPEGDNEKDTKGLEKSLNIIYEKIIDFQALAKKDNFKLVVVFTPWLNELAINKSILDPIMQAIQSENQIDVIDCRKEIRNLKFITPKNQYDYYWKIDKHFTSKGYWLWGEIVGEYLIENKIVK